MNNIKEYLNNDLYVNNRCVQTFKQQEILKIYNSRKINGK